MRTPTASSLERARECPASFIIPAAEPVETEHAARGHAVHAFLERLANGVAIEKSLEQVPAEYRAFCDSLPLETLPIVQGSYASEVAFALDLDSGSAKEIGRSIGRNYPKLYAHQLNGTADVVAIEDADTVFVADYKTGSDINLHEPANNLQLLTLGLMAARAYNRKRVHAQLIFLRDGMTWRVNGTFEDYELSAHMATLRSIFERIDAESLLKDHSVREGSWCRYCPCYRVCPAKTTLASALITGDEKLKIPLSHATIPQVWGRIKEAELVLSMIKAQVEDYTKEFGDVPMENGFLLGPVVTTKTFMDGVKLYDVLSAMLDTTYADQAVTWESNQELLEGALRKFRNATPEGQPKPKLVDLKRDVMARLEAAGGVKKSSTVTIRLHKAKE